MGYYSLRWENKLLSSDKLGFYLLSIYLTLVIQKQIPSKTFQGKESKKEISQHMLVLDCMYLLF